ncbi:flagellar hook-basal body protein [bacterium]|nr:flagellar hook-basal body protein [bacterium]MBU0899533.1 flagellar hook-basal body protein [bacterium]MBU1153823.1 flagellar hook-basal body protein [bacterium]MBU1782264.1 flagellar hook-basal body protein [bacterium]MBU2599584.1 flagellar hook-basal body protein [bacterium]
MRRGIYTGAIGMMAAEIHNDTISNNLANIDTVGFKKDVMISQSFPMILTKRINDEVTQTMGGGTRDKRPTVGYTGTGVEINEIATIFEQGSLENTQNEFDLAVEGDGFFMVKTADNKIYYTRNGSLVRDIEGYLATSKGDLVLSENNLPIKVEKDNFLVLESGKIMRNTDPHKKDGSSLEEVDTLKIVDFPNKRGLVKMGNNLFKESEVSGKPELMIAGMKIRQGFLEKSNVEAIKEMVGMIKASRLYELNAKVIQSCDSTLGNLIMLGA